MNISGTMHNVVIVFKDALKIVAPSFVKHVLNGTILGVKTDLEMQPAMETIHVINAYRQNSHFLSRMTLIFCVLCLARVNTRAKGANVTVLME